MNNIVVVSEAITSKFFKAMGHDTTASMAREIFGRYRSDGERWAFLDGLNAAADAYGKLITGRARPLTPADGSV
jgi:hypothetical protein